MADLQSLPPDQRAAVQLLLKQGQTYGQLADLLAIDESAVRRRAHDALDALGPEQGSRLDSSVQAQVADYLLGQQTVAEREETRELLADSPGARAWARVVSDALGPVAPDGLPEIPEGRPARRPAAEEERAPYATLPEEAPRASRLGGALLLGGLALIVAVVVVLLVNGGDDDRPRPATNTLSTRPATQPPPQAQNPNQPVAQINLLPPGGGNWPIGLVQVFRRGEERAILMAAQGASPATYALWPYNWPADARLLGFVPQRVGRDGRFATQGVLPNGADRFRFLVVTRENVAANQRRPPTRPGQVVLRGPLNLG